MESRTAVASIEDRIKEARTRIEQFTARYGEYDDQGRGGVWQQEMNRLNRELEQLLQSPRFDQVNSSVTRLSARRKGLLRQRGERVLQRAAVDDLMRSRGISNWGKRN